MKRFKNLIFSNINFYIQLKNSIKLRNFKMVFHCQVDSIILTKGVACDVTMCKRKHKGTQGGLN